MSLTTTTDFGVTQINVLLLYPVNMVTADSRAKYDHGIPQERTAANAPTHNILLL